jgi:hypothetical protein
VLNPTLSAETHSSIRWPRKYISAKLGTSALNPSYGYVGIEVLDSRKQLLFPHARRDQSMRVNFRCRSFQNGELIANLVSTAASSEKSRPDVASYSAAGQLATSSTLERGSTTQQKQRRTPAFPLSDPTFVIHFLDFPKSFPNIQVSRSEGRRDL